MNLQVEKYEIQKQLWPEEGKHILVQFDDHSIVVYQAFEPEIGNHILNTQRFDGPFRLNRMSWIKTNFLWMMYRSTWGTRPGQEIILAIRIKREGFDEILDHTVSSSFQDSGYTNRQIWEKDLRASSVRLQWDPDHEPSGKKCKRRAIQLGLRKEILRKYAQQWVISVEDITHFAHQQRKNLGSLSKLICPKEVIYTKV